MNVYTHVWRDEANRRDVELTVSYSREDAAVYIERLTPTKVTFFCEHGRPQRSIRVTTPTARHMLVEAYQRHSAAQPTLEQLILAQPRAAAPAERTLA